MRKFDNLHSAAVYIPYGFIVTPLHKAFYFVDLTTYFKKDITQITCKDLWNIKVMTLFVKNITGYPLFGLEQIFCGKFIPQYITKQVGFKYYNNQNTVRITRLIATLDGDNLKKQAELLLGECNRYATLYCDMTLIENKS